MNNNINFYCIGAQKAGTTTIHDILINHPDIFLPSDKEAHFFDFESRYSRGITWYLNEFFQSVGNEKIVGSITPEYMFFPKAAKRIYDDIGSDVKIVAILRNPVKRALSHYKMSKKRGLEKLPFQLAISKETERILVDEYQFKNFSYINRGYYSQQLQPYFDLFGRENVLVLIFENDIVQNLSNTVAKITDFLEIERFDLDVNIKSNQGNESIIPFFNKIIYGNNILKKIFKKIVKNESTKRYLVKNIEKLNISKTHKKSSVELSHDEEYEIYFKYFKDEIEYLEKKINIDLAIWKYNTNSNN